MSDPTGTYALRRSFLAEANRRLARVRSLTHTVLVEHDMMAARSDPMAALFPEAGHRLATFAGWFERTATEQVAGGRWWEKHLERAYQSGANTGGEMVGSPPPGHAPVPAVYRELAAREFAAIAATMVQHVSRQAAAASIAGRKALRRAMALIEQQRAEAEAEAAKSEVELARAQAALERTIAAELAGAQILQATKAVAEAELAAAQARAGAEVAAAKAATAARELEAAAAWKKVLAARRLERLALYPLPRPEEAGPQVPSEWTPPPGYETAAEVTVGVPTIPERLLKIGSEYVNSQTAEDDRVCIICQDISVEGPYTLAEAQGILRAHVNCRCAWVPAFDMRYAVNRELAAAEAE